MSKTSRHDSNVLDADVLTKRSFLCGVYQSNKKMQENIVNPFSLILFF